MHKKKPDTCSNKPTSQDIRVEGEERYKLQKKELRNLISKEKKKQLCEKFNDDIWGSGYKIVLREITSFPPYYFPLEKKSQTVSDAAYNMDWYNANACMAKDIKFIIMRSQVPLSYRAGPFGTMSFVFFGTILRGAYTYMTMQTDLKEK
ncbi:7tm Odorant receptor [Popillia japonica]|uniref:7tm Odorant receptor n=1 Tax=Popillia japonica TaxID=7064 RepID=A0AAW1KJ54_POPJA